MHLIRLLLSGVRVLRDACAPLKVDEHRQGPAAIRRGHLSWDDVERWRLSLHVELDRALAPQARGRSERNFRTRQGRLPQEVRAAAIT
jgi:hypothetical protein